MKIGTCIVCKSSTLTRRSVGGRVRAHRRLSGRVLARHAPADEDAAAGDAARSAGVVVHGRRRRSRPVGRGRLRRPPPPPPRRAPRPGVVFVGVGRRRRRRQRLAAGRRLRRRPPRAALGRRRTQRRLLTRSDTNSFSFASIFPTISFQVMDSVVLHCLLYLP